jgi:hypothetical protein
MSLGGSGCGCGARLKGFRALGGAHAVQSPCSLDYAPCDRAASSDSFLNGSVATECNQGWVSILLSAGLDHIA